MIHKTEISTEYRIEFERLDGSHYTSAGHLSLNEAKRIGDQLINEVQEYIKYKIFKVILERQTEVVHEA